MSARGRRDAVRTAIAALLALVPFAAHAADAAQRSSGDKRYGIRIGLRPGYAISQRICAECANEDHPRGWLEGLDFGVDIGDRWQVRVQALVTALDTQIFSPVKLTDESHHTYRNQLMLEIVREGPGAHRGYVFAGGGLGAYSSYDQYPTTRPGYPTDVSGSGFSLAAGLGYDWRVLRWLAIQPEAAYHHTWLGALDLNAYRSVPGRDAMDLFALSVGFAYRSRAM